MTSKTATRIGLICLLILIAWLLWPVLSNARTRNHPVPLMPRAGFSKAQTYPRRSVLVQNTDEPRFRIGMDYWNIAANWELLRFTRDGETPDIYIDNTHCCVARWSSPAPYKSCTVQLGRPPSTYLAWKEVAHELAHCLGWGSNAHRGWGIAAGYDTHIPYERHQLLDAHYYRERLCNPECRDG